MKSEVTQNTRHRMRILAVHGFTGEPFDFAPLYESALLKADWRFVTLPGHYRELTTLVRGEKQWDLFLNRIDEVVTEAREDGVALLALGYSMGARLLLRAVLESRWDLTQLMLIGVTAGLESDDERAERLEQDAKWAEVLRNDGIHAFVDAWMQQPIIASQVGTGITDPSTRLERKYLLQPHPLADALLDYSNGKLSPVWAQLSGLSLPVHLVAGERDLKFISLHSRMADSLPKAVCHVLPNSGHAPHLENTQAFLELLNTVFGALDVRDADYSNSV